MPRGEMDDLLKERKSNMREAGRRNRARRKRLLVPKKVIAVAMIPVLMVVCFLGINYYLSSRSVEASELRRVNYFSGGIENQREKQLITAYDVHEGKIAYLTFDDGPTKFLPEILDILSEHGVEGTFFFTGKNMKNESLQDNVRRAVDEGHYVGVHSMTHSFRRLYTEGYAVQEMLEAKEVLYGITGTSPNLVRFPYGTYPGLNEGLRDELAATGLKTWDWTVDSLDWKYPNDSSRVLEVVKSQINSEREVILFHETAVTVEVLPAIISYLKERGYEIKAYSEFNHFTLNFFNDERI